MDAESHENIIADDMKLQRKCVEVMTPQRAMLKFRLPWADGRTNYLAGSVHWPVWGPATTTEARLITKPPQHTPDSGKFLMLSELWCHRRYMEQMFHFNTVTRVTAYQHQPVVRTCSTSDLAPAVKTAPNQLDPLALPKGMDACYDCHAELRVWALYAHRYSHRGMNRRQRNQSYQRFQAHWNRWIANLTDIRSSTDSLESPPSLVCPEAATVPDMASPVRLPSARHLQTRNAALSLPMRGHLWYRPVARDEWLNQYLVRLCDALNYGCCGRFQEWLAHGREDKATHGSRGKRKRNGGRDRGPVRDPGTVVAAPWERVDGGSSQATSAEGGSSDSLGGSVTGEVSGVMQAMLKATTKARPLKVFDVAGGTLQVVDGSAVPIQHDQESTDAGGKRLGLSAEYTAALQRGATGHSTLEDRRPQVDSVEDKESTPAQSSGGDGLPTGALPTSSSHAAASVQHSDRHPGSPLAYEPLFVHHAAPEVRSDLRVYRSTDHEAHHDTASGVHCCVSDAWVAAAEIIGASTSVVGPRTALQQWVVCVAAEVATIVALLAQSDGGLSRSAVAVQGVGDTVCSDLMELATRLKGHQWAVSRLVPWVMGYDVVAYARFPAYTSTAPESGLERWCHRVAGWLILEAQPATKPQATSSSEGHTDAAEGMGFLMLHWCDMVVHLASRSREVSVSAECPSFASIAPVVLSSRNHGVRLRRTAETAWSGLGDRQCPWLGGNPDNGLTVLQVSVALPLEEGDRLEEGPTVEVLDVMALNGRAVGHLAASERRKLLQAHVQLPVEPVMQDRVWCQSDCVPVQVVYADSHWQDID